MELFRITLKKWSGVLQGSGYPARWNSKGVEVIYTAWARSLACLENIVHRNSFELLDNYIIMVIHSPDNIEPEVLSKSALPSDWSGVTPENLSICQAVGDNWVAQKRSAILKVPSSIIKNEYNYIINPGHQDSKRIKIIDEEPFFFDSRLKPPPVTYPEPAK